MKEICGFILLAIAGLLGIVGIILLVGGFIAYILCQYEIPSPLPSLTEAQFFKECVTGFIISMCLAVPLYFAGKSLS